MIVAAIDPGKVTGIATWESRKPEVVHVREVPTIYEVADHVTFLHENTRDQALFIVAEQFVISERTIRTAQDHSALRVIGWLDIYCHLNQIPLDLQTAAQAKRFATNEKLKALDWWRPTKDGHQNDATRHLVVYLRKAAPEVWREFIIPRIAKEIL